MPCLHKEKIILANCLATTHPKIAKQWHPTKNNLTPLNVGKGSKKLFGGNVVKMIIMFRKQ